MLDLRHFWPDLANSFFTFLFSFWLYLYILFGLTEVLYIYVDKSIHLFFNGMLIYCLNISFVWNLSWCLGWGMNTAYFYPFIPMLFIEEFIFSSPIWYANF